MEPRSVGKKGHTTFLSPLLLFFLLLSFFPLHSPISFPSPPSSLKERMALFSSSFRSFLRRVRTPQLSFPLLIRLHIFLLPATLTFPRSLAFPSLSRAAQANTRRQSSRPCPDVGIGGFDLVAGSSSELVRILLKLKIHTHWKIITATKEKNTV